MKLFATLTALLLSHIAASAAILIFDGPAPVKTYGSESGVRRNRAILVYDTATSQVGIINYFGGRGRGRGEQVFLGAISVDGGTISQKRGSITVLSGVSRTNPQGEDFDTRMVSLRGRNSLLNRTTDLTGPRVLSGTARVTNRIGTVLTHWEQSFSAVYQRKLSNAANAANDTFAAAIDRVETDLEKRGFDSLGVR